ncbi:methylmalonyl-CoA epimerase [Corynebacterium pygosceleis]|uniref:Methylmalonyl-CoA epimerase n=1 Tax=Corynebacterium pygosceleis TaxID=2800406 RepID=A0A9Q4C8L8_9CORY|nr:methylmalonyl-CoA epimerase [Corynebacterium pygosceleis]MCK7637909.1 methylmalonyl-CoA epimerase [Corynebacterium pygosceleis]MCK7675624.1 methylmalonyl-CoA epimerase [Corynebacterium pygosceleis]MCL0120982.1 methylmalonyl-CoA epimerase [Corynebacterium pygosceleis]MCX7444552.1 methylmalonyl-CoA epimerase [Corynebacterium pygosceleis]MCX7468625.1 methylmalonyl-CoA epimerase [Corynebacterium pygosceleis]
MNHSIDIPHEYVTCLDHVGIAVPDLDAAVEFYRSAFGWVNLHQETNEEQGVVEAMVGPADTDATAPTAGVIQLLAPLNEDSTIATFLEKKGPGLQQMCLRTDNMDALCEHLRGLGVRLLYPEPKRGTGGARINFVHPRDAGGVLLELTEPVAAD